MKLFAAELFKVWTETKTCALDPAVVLRCVFLLVASSNIARDPEGRATSIAAFQLLVTIFPKASAALDPGAQAFAAFFNSVLHFLGTNDVDPALDAMKNPNFDPNFSRWLLTPLQLAVLADAEEVVSELLERGANPNPERFEPPLFLAQSPSAAVELLRAGADPNARGLFGPFKFNAFELCVLAFELELAKTVGGARPTSALVTITAGRPDLVAFVAECGGRPDAATQAALARAFGSAF